MSLIIFILKPKQGNLNNFSQRGGEIPPQFLKGKQYEIQKSQHQKSI